VRFLPGTEAVWAALPEARVVGGAVRDFLAGRAVADVDFAVPLTPEVFSARLAAAGMKVVPTGIAHGTVTAVVGDVGFEVTALRRDVAADGRHAVVEFTDDWEADAARRDFTINAMSMDRDGEIFDYFGGRADLAAGVVRFVGAARDRIAEDYLRVLRFFRFFARYGGVPDAEAVAAITALRDGVLGLSGERVWSEIKRIMMADDPRTAVRLMARTGVLGLLVPEGVDLARFERVARLTGGVDGLLRVAALVAGDVERFGERLKLSNEELDFLVAVHAPLGLAPGAGDDEVRRALADAPAEILVARTYLVQDEGSGWDELRGRLRGMTRPVFPLQGRDVVEMGVAPGPLVGETLAAVRGWWMAGGCVADFESCKARARQMLG